MPNTPGIIFDMDGVIVDSNPAHKEAIQLFCKKHSQDLSQNFIENRLYGRTNKEWIPELFGEISDAQLKELADEKEEMFRDMFNPEDHIVDGIHDFIEDLKQANIPMAVGTSAPKENADYILGRLFLKDYFDVILDSSDVTHGKPHPEIYLKAAKALDRKPTNCIVFEDSVSGVAAGRKAGATVIGVTTTHTQEELSPCARVIESFTGIKPSQITQLVLA